MAEFTMKPLSLSIMVLTVLCACGDNAESRRDGAQTMPVESPGINAQEVYEVYEKDGLMVIVRISEWYDSGHYLPGTSTLVSYGHRRVITSAVGVDDEGQVHRIAAEEAQAMIDTDVVNLVSREEGRRGVHLDLAPDTTTQQGHAGALP